MADGTAFSVWPLEAITTTSISPNVNNNRPFPSSCLPSLESKSKCEVFVMVISSTLHMNEK